MRSRTVIVVCIAIFALTAITAVPMFAIFDAQTAIDALFWSPTSARILSSEDDALPAAPVVDPRSPRGPPIA